MKITVITATYNSDRNIECCLDSIAMQTYKNIEHIIIDGNSNDSTLKKIENHPFNSTKIITEPDKGIYFALNKGIKYSTGDVIGFLHSDDFFPHDRVIEDICKEFKKNQSLNAVYGDLEYVSQKDTKKIIRKWKSKPFKPILLGRGWMPPHPSLYVKKKSLESIKGFDTSFRISADYMFILQIFSKEDFKSSYLPKVLVKMRVGGTSNRSLSKIFLKSKEDWNALRKNNFNNMKSVRALVSKNFSKVTQFF